MKLDLSNLALQIVDKPVSPVQAREFKIATRVIAGSGDALALHYTVLEPSAAAVGSTLDAQETR